MTGRIRSTTGALLGTALAIALAAVVSSCFVSRRSSDFECAVNADCDGGRQCDRGFCVGGPAPIDGSTDGCPAACNDGCDLVDGTCSIECTQPGQCGDVVCPPGFACTITCSTGACGDIECPAASDRCELHCLASGACGDIECGPGVPCEILCEAGGACGDINCRTSSRCDVRCQAGAACGDIACMNACACDVVCADGNCGQNVCPTAGGMQCTEGGIAGKRCDSGDVPNCSTCT